MGVNHNSAHVEYQKENETRSFSAKKGEVALPAAHLAAHGGQYGIDVSLG